MEHAQKNGFKEIYLTPPLSVYFGVMTQNIEYALLHRKFDYHVHLYSSVVDLRSNEEKFGDMVKEGCDRRGMTYVAIPIALDGIYLDDVLTFHRTVYARNVAPLYVFSRQGRKPLALMITFDSVMRGMTLAGFRAKARQLGLDLDGIPSIASFIVAAMKEEQLIEETEKLKRARPDLFDD